MTLQMLTEADDKQLITITPEWMKEKFDQMNELLFDGKLKPCKLSLFTSGKGSRGGTLGWFKHKPLFYSKSRQYGGKHPCYVKDWWGDKIWLDEDNFNQYAEPQIELNGNYNWTEKAALSTLVHEMCHYYDYKDGWAPVQAHGPSFRNIAAWVSRKSNEFFTVERLARAEQMKEMEFTDSMKAFNNRRAAKGIKYFKMEFEHPEMSSRGKVYKYAYAIPSATIADNYSAYLKSKTESRFSRAVECVTTDGAIKNYHTVAAVGRYYYSPAATFEEVLGDVKADSEVEIAIGGDNQTLNEPWYLFRFKYKTPYRQNGRTYTWGYWLSKPTDFFKFRNYLNTLVGDKYSYADYFEIYDAAVLGHKPSNAKNLAQNYISQSEEVLPNVQMGTQKIIFGAENKDTGVARNVADNNPLSGLSNFLYGSGGNPHIKNPQPPQPQAPTPTPPPPPPAPEKRYTFSIPLMKNGQPSGTFTINSATEAEAKEQMRQRFPGWSQEVIDAKFQKYAKPLPQNNIALQEGDMRYVVEQVCEQLAHSVGAT